MVMVPPVIAAPLWDQVCVPVPLKLNPAVVANPPEIPIVPVPDFEKLPLMLMRFPVLLPAPEPKLTALVVVLVMVKLPFTVAAPTAVLLAASNNN